MSETMRQTATMDAAAVLERARERGWENWEPEAYAERSAALDLAEAAHALSTTIRRVNDRREWHRVSPQSVIRVYKGKVDTALSAYLATLGPGS